MTTRVIFTRRRKDNETSKLYTRVNVPFEHQNGLIESVNKNRDPLITKCNIINGIDSSEIYLIENIVFVIDILVLNDGNFEQYRGEIDNIVIENVLNSSLVLGMEPLALYVWLYGLIALGEYDDGETYRYELVSTGTELYWTIKMIDNGIYKTVLSIKMCSVKEIDIDEYFLEDLEQFWNKSVEYKQREKEWQMDKEKLMLEMEMLRKKTGIEHLQNSLKNMKTKITDYFLPLVNNLLLEKKRLLANSTDEGDAIFLRAVKRKRNNDEEIEEMKGGKEENEMNVLDIDAFMEAERRKRMKLAESFKGESKIDMKSEESKALKFEAVGTDVDTDEDSINFNKKRNLVGNVNDNDEEVCNVLDNKIEQELFEMSNEQKDSELVVLEEDTDADENDTDPNATEISTEAESENVTEEDTQI